MREYDIEEEGTVSEFNQEILHPTLQSVLERQLVSHKRKRTLSPPIKKSPPSENCQPSEQFESP
jgi:hypothetical protein